ncbi:MAG: DUF4198 domain-containing protein [Xanthomonadales bacterium]|nr:DUF4198 domain-containing protein [Xanthomonadales bacterium]
MKPLCTSMLALLAAFATNVLAHTPYLAPNTFAPREGAVVTLDAAFAETFFVPEVVFDKSRFEITAPDGTKREPDSVQYFRSRALVEHTMPKQAGTWRFSTGPRVGAVFRNWEIDGHKESTRDPEAVIPEGATRLPSYQAITLAETYLTIGAPDRGALKPRGSGIEIIPVTHPADLYSGESFVFEVLQDGKPVADEAVEVTEAVWTSDRRPEVVRLKTAADGRATLALRRAGTWLALVRHRTEAPAGAPADEYSLSATLVFQVRDP